jgi:hypothetical protein
VTLLAHAREPAIGLLEPAVAEQLLEHVHRQRLFSQTLSEQIAGLSKIGPGEAIVQEVFKFHKRAFLRRIFKSDGNVRCRPKTFLLFSAKILFANDAAKIDQTNA